MRMRDAVHKAEHRFALPGQPAAHVRHIRVRVAIKGEVIGFGGKFGSVEREIGPPQRFPHGAIPVTDFANLNIQAHARASF